MGPLPVEKEAAQHLKGEKRPQLGAAAAFEGAKPRENAIPLEDVDIEIGCLVRRQAVDLDGEVVDVLGEAILECASRLAVPLGARAHQLESFIERCAGCGGHSRRTCTTPECLEPEEDLWTDDTSGDHAGWFCVATDPFPCPAEGCPFVALFMTAVHLILVWEKRDDPNLLRHAQRAMEVGRNPRVVVYEPEFGPSASYYAWEAAGRPVHAVKKL